MLETRTRTTPIADDRRPLIRRTAAGIAMLIALIYFLIGFQLVAVLEDTSEQTAFGLIAGGAFVIGAALILAFDRRWLWTMGTLAQLFIIWTYFNLADQRAPDFEFWGLSIRVLQVILTALLVYLAVVPPRDQVEEPMLEGELY
jgi:hypothetical protein